MGQVGLASQLWQICFTMSLAAPSHFQPGSPWTLTAAATVSCMTRCRTCSGGWGSVAHSMTAGSSCCSAWPTCWRTRRCCWCWTTSTTHISWMGCCPAPSAMAAVSSSPAESRTCQTATLTGAEGKLGTAQGLGAGCSGLLATAAAPPPVD